MQKRLELKFFHSYLKIKAIFAACFCKGEVGEWLKPAVC